MRLVCDAEYAPGTFGLLGRRSVNGPSVTFSQTDLLIDLLTPST